MIMHAWKFLQISQEASCMVVAVSPVEALHTPTACFASCDMVTEIGCSELPDEAAHHTGHSMFLLPCWQVGTQTACAGSLSP